ncbi:hypothetical protein ASF10_09060 [Flavobacterium sp. Leaf82]|uniref:hypothetical protein n=1 Tax=unclassified Flavobacterium TaxID=196869 RepID=UPI0006FD9A01|nr:hypothetical protein [Flavobacterium sp. Leaf82]KQO22514.1 hypothetical protein ASF10_09060 [Flavobacterium sp. Leaf82]
MKKYASLLLFALLLNGCDDGDLKVDTIDFDDTSIVSQSCDPLTNNLIYRLKSQESLLIQLPDDKIINDPTVANTPLIYDIDNTTYRVVYRAYDGTVATANICGAIPPTSPKVTEEWQATAGQIVIVTTQDFTTADDGSTKITGYTHNITFKNITFLKPSGPQVEEEFSFGDFKTTVTPVVVSFTDENADYCPDTKKIYNDNTVSSLVLENLADGLIVNEATPTGKPRTNLINANGANKLYYRTYSGALPADTQSYFCTEKTPTTPAILETWFGQDGAVNVSGIIEVTTTNDLKVFRHKVVLRNATLQKGNSTFKLATTFLLGTVTTIAP